MQTSVMKSLACWAIAKEIKLPYAQLDRMSELSYLRHLLLQLEIDCVLDVGANIGQFAGELRGIGYEGHIVSFEPISAVFKTLSDGFAGDARWDGFNMALGRAESEMTIHVPKLTVMSSLLESGRNEPGMRREVVQVKTLDAMLPGIKAQLDVSRIFLKMDTQGYDLEVFNGARACLADILAIQSELSVQPLYKDMPHYIESLQTYESAGYELYNLSVVNRIESGGLLELNCFMRKTVR